MSNIKTKEILQRVKNWQELKYQLESLSAKDKGDIFELLTKYYLILNPTYATKIKNVWLFNEIPQSKIEYLKLPTKDQGIDLIAETKEGQYWAIQCKYREDETKSLTWREVSTFAGLSFSVCKHISFGLICTTTERFTKVLKKQNNIGFCSSEVWRDLDAEFFSRLHLLIDHLPALPIALKPRPHQKRAINNAAKHYLSEKNTRGKMIMPCGTGKSLTGYWIADKLNAKTILVAVPSLALIKQTLGVWLRESIAKNKKVDWICVCSDQTVGEISKDDIVAHTQDLGIPCVTDIDEITKWFKSVPKNGLRIVFTTYQSGKVIAEASRNLNIVYDLGIMDEAHKTVGQSGKLFTHLLDDNNILIKHRLFMTATERRYLGKSDEIASMENPKIYGETFELLTFKEALDAKPAILSDYKIITMFVSKSETADLIQKNVFVKPGKGIWNEEIEAENFASLIALRKAMKEYPIKHAISFHSGIRRAELFKENQDRFTQTLEDFGKLDTFHVSGILPAGTRQRILDEFAKSDRSLITNARCLTEGVDVPNIDCVLFADPKRSAIDIVQAVGRALRPSKGKKFGYIIIPILVENEVDAVKIIETSAFASILTILRALASNDERIIEYFRAISHGRRSKDGKIININIDEKIAKEIDLDNFISAVQLKCWNKLAKLSWRPFEEARVYTKNFRFINTKEWFGFCRGEMPEKGELPKDIPKHPQLVYKNEGWKGWGYWLGTSTTATRLRKYRPFEMARHFITQLNLEGQDEWIKYTKGLICKKEKWPEDIPKKPDHVYRNNGWKGWGYWLGTGSIATYLRIYRNYYLAKRYVRKLKLRNHIEWVKFCLGEIQGKSSLPSDIPSNPQRVYKNKGWTSWGDWLDTRNVAGQVMAAKYLLYKEAIKYVRKLKISSQSQWYRFVNGKILIKERLPSNIPKYPQQTYRNKGWENWGKWLGTGRIADQLRKYRSFNEARKYVQNLGLKNLKEWKIFCAGKYYKSERLPEDIPKKPQNTYKDKGWRGYVDWLGTNKNKFRSFREARSFVRKLRLKGQLEWFKYSRNEILGKIKKPDDIPYNPYNTYKNKGWISWPDWLGKK